MASCIPSFDDARRRPSSACNAIEGCFDWLARLLRLLAVSFDGETFLPSPITSWSSSASGESGFSVNSVRIASISAWLGFGSFEGVGGLGLGHGPGPDP